MPVYLCQPGTGSNEPWRHGIQVYAAPFAMDDRPPRVINSPSNNAASETVAHTAVGFQWDAEDDDRPETSPPSSSAASSGVAIRRVRHSEVVLVDDVCIAHDRYWLRLRWTGRRGGFAGYIALGKVGQGNWLERATSESTGVALLRAVTGDFRPSISSLDATVDIVEARNATDENDDPAREDEDPTRDQDNLSTRSAEPFELSSSTPQCVRTGISFPSSVAMKLLSMYDDGIQPPVSSAPLPSEPVFCRICREGLHDDADEQQPTPAVENDDGENMMLQNDPRREDSASPDVDDLPTAEADMEDEAEPTPSQPNSGTPLSKGPVLPHPVYRPNSHAAENPMLAPCECSGSMAFVHYLCVEQWRCRSRHPEARNGLNCETCGTAYALPPPTTRPNNVPSVDNEDWLEAMPPHVMAALREPHIWWQIGAYIVRKRWLRPIAPVIMSPLVALYCRARRLLKKKGVARRRWACSLCRRRARWKCVRCLRSYYCSRQCQNVSWHIVHKHVCYKPSRFWLSVVVYGMATLFLFPGVLRDPLMYDLGLGFIPASFFMTAIIGGGIASILKKSFGVDLRGRAFEVVVVLFTAWLVFVWWGLVEAFFGNQSKCYGVFGSYSISEAEMPVASFLSVVRVLLLKPARLWFQTLDRLAQMSGPWLRKALCSRPYEANAGCFQHLPDANDGFFLAEYDGEKCAADLLTVGFFWVFAGLVSVGNDLLKRQERRRRALRRPRVHQD